MPVSPCGNGCIPAQHTETGVVTRASRVVRAAGVLASAPALFALQQTLPAPRREELHRIFARLLLSSLGIRIIVRDRRGVSPQHNRGVLVVANHISWLDPFAISAVAPSSFVARADLLKWPGIGWLAKWGRTVPVAREELRTLPAAVEQVAGLLSLGRRIAVFPEGTTWCGRSWGKMRPAFFQAAFDSGAVVSPVHIRYRDAEGEINTTPCFVGDDGLGDSLKRVLRMRDATVEVTLLPYEPPLGDRKTLAARCEARLRRADSAALNWSGFFSPDPVVA